MDNFSRFCRCPSVRFVGLERQSKTSSLDGLPRQTSDCPGLLNGVRPKPLPPEPPLPHAAMGSLFSRTLHQYPAHKSVLGQPLRVTGYGWLEIKKQRLDLKLPAYVRAMESIQPRNTGHRSEIPHLSCLYPGPGPLGHHPHLTTIGQIAHSELEPEFLQPLENLTVTQGRDVVFTCVVNHLGQYKVAWIKSDSKAILAIHTHLVAHNLRLAVTHNGHNTWKLHISNVQKNDSGTYMCQINTDPMRSQMGHLEIVVPPDILSDESSDGGVALEGGSIRLRCKVTGVPEPSVQWRREDSKNIVLRHEGGREKTVERTVKGEILSLTNVQRSDMGVYLCIASNGVPPSVSKRFLVQVHFQPSIQVTNQLVAAPIGSDVILQCYVEASPKAMNSWYKEKSEKLIEGMKYSMTEHPVSDYGLMMNLTIRLIERRDLGAYLCSSSNALGTASGAVRLQEIYMPPKTTISPKSNNNIHVFHKPTHSPKKSKLKPKKEEFLVTSSTTSERSMYQTISPSISRPPFWVIEEPSGSSSKQSLCLPLMNVCSVAAAFWVPAYLNARFRHFSIL